MTANAIALMARSLSFDSEFLSPFSVSARRNNINATGECVTYFRSGFDVQCDDILCSLQVANRTISPLCWPLSSYKPHTASYSQNHIT